MKRLITFAAVLFFVGLAFGCTSGHYGRVYDHLRKQRCDVYASVEPDTDGNECGVPSPIFRQSSASAT